MARTDPPPPYDAILRDWWIIDFLDGFSLVGRIFYDSRTRFPDGRWIITSAVRTPRRKVIDGEIIRTRNTRYLLVGVTN